MKNIFSIVYRLHEYFCAPLCPINDLAFANSARCQLAIAYNGFILVTCLSPIIFDLCTGTMFIIVIFCTLTDSSTCIL